MPIRVTNPSAHWFRKLRATLVDTNALLAPASSEGTDLAPGQLSRLGIPLSLHGNHERVPLRECPLRVKFVVQAEVETAGKDTPRTVTAKGEVALRCRGRGESFQFTFRARDGTPQVAAAKQPKQKSACGTRGCAILLSTHGMDVTGLRQADCYRQKASLWVLAPHGRSTHASNWQGCSRI